jgi:hypothetical protein
MSGSDLEGLRNKLRLIGFSLCVVVPAVSLILVWSVFQDTGLAAEAHRPEDAVVVWVLTGFALVDTAAGSFLRRVLLRVDSIAARCGNDVNGVNQAILVGHFVGFAVALSPAFIGLALQIVTHKPVLASVLIGLAPLAYLFNRPTEATVDDLAREVSAKLAR